MLEFVAFAIMAVAHFAGLAALVVILVRGDNLDWSALWPKDEDDPGRGGPPAASKPDGPRHSLGLALPLEGGEPAHVRLRGPRGPLMPRPVRRGRDPAPDDRPVVPSGHQ